jgi:6-phosphogluconolactonase (cycloisomerase 2 family)
MKARDARRQSLFGDVAKPLWVATVCAGLASGASPAHAVPLDGIRAVAISADGAYVYAVAEFADAIVVFRRAGSTGALTPIQVVHDAAAGPHLDAVDSVALSPDGHHLYAAAFVSSALNVFARDAGSGLLSFVEAQVEGVGGVDGIRSAHGAVVTPDGAHVYVTGYEDDAVAAFARDPHTGKLSFVEAERDGVAGVDGLDAAVWIAVSPDGAHLYVAGAADSAVAVFARDTGSGALSFLQVLRNGIDGVVGLGGARSTLVSPDGRYVYVGSGAILVSPSDNAIVAFARDPATGLLTFSDAWFDGVDGVTGLFGVYEIAFAAGGASLYAASFGANAVVAFDRDAATGALTFRQAIFDAPAALGGAHAVAASPDDAHVYVGAFNEPALGWFARDPDTGALTFAGAVESGPDAFDQCPPTLPLACGKAARAKLVLKQGERHTRLTFAWRRGAATTLADLGNPITGTTRYRLCVYDSVGDVTTLRTSAATASDASCSGIGGCWLAVRRGLYYQDASGTPGVLASLALRPGEDGQAGVRARVAADGLVLPALPFTPPVSALVLNSDGGCWGSTFGLENVRRNTGGLDAAAVFTAVR